MAFKDPERARAYYKAWAEANRDKLRENNRKYRARNSDRLRAAASTEESLARRREKYRKNQAKVSTQRQEYYQKNRAAILEQQQDYRSKPGKREAQQVRAAKWYEVNGDKTRAAVMYRMHGLRPEDWAKLWDTQGGRCYLCGDEMAINAKNGRGPHVEHDHSCCGPRKSCHICQRGLACADCNAAIGYAHEDPARLRRMADALEVAQAAFAVRKASSGEQLMLG